jgi:hypothetical protein
MGFNDLKKNTGMNEGLLTELNKISSGSKKSYQDDRFWKPERDKSGNGFAVIRFLSAPEGEETPFVRLFSHGFKGRGGWLIDNCPTTIGLKCPVCEANNDLWNSGDESDKDIARNRKRKLQYIANILVISDPKNPHNEGKVFLYKFGKRIFDKVQGSMQPEFEDEDAINPFCFWSGANFKLKIREVAGFVNYDKSEFDSSSALLDGDNEKLEALWKTQYSLQEFIAPDQFKSYDELKTRLGTVVGDGDRSSSHSAPTTAESTEINSSTSSETSDSNTGAEGADDALSYFEKLANED